MYIQKPWNKFFPYGFGIIVGIIIWKYNNSNIKGTYVAKISKLIQQNSLISWSMHIIATILITTMIVTIHPIDHDRNGDTKFASSIWLVCSQIFIPLGLTLHLLPMCFGKSLRLRAVMSLNLMKPFSVLLYIMIPLSGTVIQQIGYNLRYGIKFDFKLTLALFSFILIALFLISLIFAIFFILPLSFPVRAFFSKYRSFKPENGPESKHDSEHDSLIDKNEEENLDNEEAKQSDNDDEI